MPLRELQRFVLLGAFGVILVVSLITSRWVLTAAAVMGIVAQLLAIAMQKDQR